MFFTTFHVKIYPKIYNFLSNQLSEYFEEYIGTRYDWRINSESKLSQAVWGEKLLDEEKLNQNNL